MEALSLRETFGHAPYKAEPTIPTDEPLYFHWADYVVFALFLVISLAIGIYQGWQTRKQQTAESFLMANRSLHPIPVSLSLLTAFLSAILVLGTPAEMYTAGTMYWMCVWGQMLACLFACLLFVPLLYPLNLTSSYEYLEDRFHSKTAKLTGTIILIAMQLFYMGVCLYSPATALEAVTGFPEWASIILGGVISLFYVMLGGMKASVWTSAFQAFVMAAGVIAVIIVGCIDLDGFGEVWKLNDETGRIDFFDFDPNPLERHTFWTTVVGSWVGWLVTYGVNQAAVQRYCSVKDLKNARITVLLNIPGLFIMVTLCAMSGMVIFAWYYYVGCDIYKSGIVDNSNQIIPYYVMDRLGYPCVPGLFLACLFAGALSTMSSSVGACAAVTWQDMIRGIWPDLSDRTQTIINKVLVLVYGGAGIGMAFMVSGLGGSVLQMSLSFTGAAGGPMLGMFMLGGIFPFANWLGAVIGGFLGLGFPLWISFGSYSLNLAEDYKNSSVENCNHTFPNTTWSTRTKDDVEGLERLYLVSYLWYPAIGMATVVVMGLLISCCTGFTDVRKIEAKYQMPFFDRLFCCLPNKSLRVLRCYIEREKAEDEIEEGEEGIDFGKKGNDNYTYDYSVEGINYVPSREYTPTEKEGLPDDAEETEVASGTSADEDVKTMENDAVEIEVVSETGADEDVKNTGKDTSAAVVANDVSATDKADKEAKDDKGVTVDAIEVHEIATGVEDKNDSADNKPLIEVEEIEEEADTAL